MESEFMGRGNTGLDKSGLGYPDLGHTRPGNSGPGHSGSGHRNVEVSVPHARVWRALTIGGVIAVSIILGSCSSNTSSRRAEVNPQVYKLGDKVPEGGGVRKTGSRYKIKGRWYKPQETAYASQVGVASWYGEYFHGRKTANGEWYDMERLSAAHPTMPIPSYVRVTNLENRRSIVVRVNDRGPYASERIIDMSHAAAEELGFVRQGTVRVKVKYIGDAPLEGDIPDMQYADRGNNGRRPLITASTTNGSKSIATPPKPKPGSAGSDVSVAKGGPKSSPLADELLANGPLGYRRPVSTASVPGKTTLGEKPRLGRPDTTLSTKPLKLKTKKSKTLKTSDNRHGFYIQAASFRQLDHAQSLKDELAHLGIFDILPVEIGSDTFYRVRVGPFPEEGEAVRFRKKIAETGLQDARVFAR